MPDSTSSFEKFNYTIRPSKQVERKLLIEIFHHLAHNFEYSFKEYTYLGMGSVFYADFVLFHKFLYVDNMICIEGDDIKPRMQFNKPYEFIELRMGKVSDILPKLRFKNIKYIVWLDYDSTLDQEALGDLDSFLKKLEAGSFIIVTVDAEPKLRNEQGFSKYSTKEKDNMLLSHYNKCAEGLVDSHIAKRNLSRNSLPRLIIDIISNRIRKSVSFRTDNTGFLQLFNYLYADGAQMLSFGGLIDRVENINSTIKSGVLKHQGIIPGSSPYKITVPPLTSKEKGLLDSFIKKDVKLNSIKRKLPFELDDKFIESYIDNYRHYPSYHEIIM